jgi:FMN phosphatase YigB (HAD superfamily)
MKSGLEYTKLLLGKVFMQKKFVFFDLGNTLVRIKKQLLEYCVQRISIEAGKNLTNAIQIEHAILQFKKAEMAEWNATPTENINYIKYEQQELQFWQNFYRSVLLRLGHSRPTTDLSNLLAEIPTNPNSFELFEDVVDTLELLRLQDITLGIISNAFPSAKQIVESLKLRRWFEYIILSYEHDVLPKPHPHIYNHAIEQANVKFRHVNSVFFIDDRLHFVEGATKPEVGMSAFLIDRDCTTPEYVPPERLVPQNEGTYKKIIDLRQIPAYINSTSYQHPLLSSSSA